MRWLLLAVVLILMASVVSAAPRGQAHPSPSPVYPSPEVSEEEAIALITFAIPQAHGEGYQAAELSGRYYQEHQLRSIARSAIIASRKYNLPVIYLLAVVDVQSHFRFDAIGDHGSSFGCAQIHCKKRGVCHQPPRTEELAKLLDCGESILLLGAWAHAWRGWCGKKGGRCALNARLTGIPGWIGPASVWATGWTIRHYLGLLEGLRARKARVM